MSTVNFLISQGRSTTLFFDSSSILDIVSGVGDLLRVQFHPDIVFSSLDKCIGSGYVFIVLAILGAISVISKVLKLLAIVAVCGLIWFLCASGIANSCWNYIVSLV